MKLYWTSGSWNLKTYLDLKTIVFDDKFKARMITANSDPSVENNEEELNAPLKFTEIKYVVDHLPTRKAVGVDLIPSELLKNECVKKLLFTLFRVCFRNKLIPDVWRKAIIHPIPKIPGKQIDPQKYHGLALQSCIFKVFSSIINR